MIPEDGPKAFARGSGNQPWLGDCSAQVRLMSRRGLALNAIRSLMYRKVGGGI
jgi:hypothetical protein